jgi:uncharacterized protein (TIGR04255 family)
MNFPEFERVIYRHNPLVEVVCQLRFSPILKIAHQEPVEFQDEIRSEYPLFEKVQPLPLEILNIAQQMGVSLNSDLALSFKSEDQKWNLSITKDFISLGTSSYERYEQFKQRFEDAIRIFERIYKPSFYTRVGLRYRDLIIRSKLGIQDRLWSELISQHIAAELQDSELSPSIESLTKHLILNVENGQISFKHGLVTIEDPQGNTTENAYLIDADFYTEQKIKGEKDVWNILNQFNQTAGGLFRWSITDVLHDAMQPQPVNTEESDFIRHGIQ